MDNCRKDNIKRDTYKTNRKLEKQSNKVDESQKTSIISEKPKDSYIDELDDSSASVIEDILASGDIKDKIEEITEHDGTEEDLKSKRNQYNYP